MSCVTKYDKCKNMTSVTIHGKCEKIWQVLQNVTHVTKCDKYYKTWQVWQNVECYKIWQVWQNVSVTKPEKWDKMRKVWKNALSVTKFD